MRFRQCLPLARPLAIFAAGLFVGLALKKSAPASHPVDFSGEIRVIRMVKPAGVSKRFVPYCYYEDSKPYIVSPPPADPAVETWLITLGHGRVKVSAVEVPFTYDGE